jgi:beta-lactamase regulating signal transducer with metallopeptidase domain
MIDLVLKTALLAAVAGWLTRRSRLDAAVDAHRLWMLVLISPVLLVAINAALPPVAYVVPRIAVPSPVPSEWTLVVYVLVAGALLARVGAGLWSVRALSRGARRLGRADLARLRALAGDAGLDIRESDLKVPVTAGVLRPCVILPRDWRHLAAPALLAVLHHERAHVRRRDCTVALAAALVEAVFWFCPAVWIASARVRWFAEMACDAAAAREVGQHQYAGELLDLAAGWAGARSPRYAITAGAETHVARRIRLLIEGLPADRRQRSLLPVVLLLMIAATPLSGLVRFSGSRSVAPPAGAFLGHLHVHRPHSASGIAH